MKKMIVVSIIIVAAILVSAVAFVMIKPAQTVKHVFFQLSWIPVGDHMAYYAAKEKYWPALGLDVTIVKGSGSGDTILKVGQGVADFGEAAFESGLELRAVQLYPVRMIFDVSTETHHGFIYIKNRDAGRGVIDPNNIKSLEGKITGEPAWSAIVAELPAFAALAGFDASKLEIIDMDPGAKIPALINGSTDLTGLSLSNTAAYETAIKEALPDAEVGLIWFKDYGFRMVGDGVWTTDKLIAQDSETVKKFVEGLQQGWAFAAANPDEAARIMSAELPEYKGTEGDLVQGFYDLFSATTNMEVQKTRGVGWMPPDLIEASVKNAYIIMNIPEDSQLSNWEDIYTNNFINPSILATTAPWE